MNNIQSDYVEWLSEVERLGGEFAWIREEKKFFFSNTQHDSTAKVCALVLNSQKVKEAIGDVAKKQNCARKDVEKEAKNIISEMAHNFQLGAIKPIGYAVVKVVKQIFKAIYVNLQKLDEIKKLCEKNLSVVFMPTHKSYLDFLLISILCFDRQVPLPAICAGEDFRASFFLGEALRRCGAFFIRRSFSNDILYWAIFSEYVQVHLIHNIRPVEFFLEGQRSRTGKSIYPKNGLFQVVLEPFLNSNLFDIILAPVTINYDKFLEESLYGRELLGFPKPKETAAGLFKAREILRKNFGNIFVTFAEPISVREYFSKKLAFRTIRSQLAFKSQFQVSLQDQMRSKIRKLSHLIVQIQNQSNVINIWPFICFTILQSQGIYQVSFSTIFDKVNKIKSLFEKLNLSVIILSTSLDAEIRNFLNLHKNLLKIGDNNEIILNCNNKTTNLTDQLINHLILFNYTNLLSSQLSPFSMFAISVAKRSGKRLQVSLKTSDLLNDFRFLCKIFTYEFISVPNKEEKLFLNVLKIFQDKNILIVSNLNDTIEIINADFLKYLNQFFEHWIICYIIIFRSIYRTIITTSFIKNNSNVVNTSQKAQIIELCRNEIFSIFKKENFLGVGAEKNTINDCNKNETVSELVVTSLSIDTIKNAFAQLVSDKCVQLNNSNLTMDKEQVLLNRSKLLNVIRQLENFVPDFINSRLNYCLQAKRLSETSKL